MGGAKSEASILSKEGPQFPAAYALNNFSASVFVREAPMVVEYQLGRESTATMMFTVKIKKEEKSFTKSLEPTGNEIREVKFSLPEYFGKKPRAGTLSVKAENIDQNNKRPPAFELTGLCMGEKACGSIGIDRLSFESTRVRATQKEKVAYSFHSLFDFGNVFAEFRLLGLTPGGEPATQLVHSEKISGIRRGESVSREWNGKNQKDQVSKGRHQLVVTAWYGEKQGGDYALASSKQRVQIE
jgi:hypothetical protein